MVLPDRRSCDWPARRARSGVDCAAGPDRGGHASAPGSQRTVGGSALGCWAVSGRGRSAVPPLPAGGQFFELPDQQRIEIDAKARRTTAKINGRSPFVFAAVAGGCLLVAVVIGAAILAVRTVELEPDVAARGSSPSRPAGPSTPATVRDLAAREVRDPNSHGIGTAAPAKAVA